jgi:aminoglycoside 3-N-acetyltransferase I
MNTSDVRTKRLTPHDRDAARTLFALMAGVFDEPASPLGDDYIDRLLARQDFWAIVALVDDRIVGGLTAHTLPMTRGESSEIFLYDVAVQIDHQRMGVGRQLVTTLRSMARAAGIRVVFVPADDEDVHALDFYRALGGAAAPVTIFTFE